MATATAAAILGCPHPDTLATHHAHGGLTVSDDGANMSVAGDTSVAIPEHAQARYAAGLDNPCCPTTGATTSPAPT